MTTREERTVTFITKCSHCGETLEWTEDQIIRRTPPNNTRIRSQIIAPPETHDHFAKHPCRGMVRGNLLPGEKNA